MRHPFEQIPTDKRRRVFLPLLIATIFIFIFWVITVIPMANEKAPLSVSSFGMAGSVQNAREMIASWGEPARLSGAFGIGFDFLQLVIYSTTFAMACAWIAQMFRRRNLQFLSNLGFVIAWGQWLAVLFGTIQNAVMMSLLLGFNVDEVWMQASYWSTLFKLILLFLGPTYAALGYLFWIAKGNSLQKIEG
jgi:hypothetical protein